MCDKLTAETEGISLLSSFGISDIGEDALDVNTSCRLCMTCTEKDLDMIEILTENPHFDSSIPDLFADGLGIDVNDASLAGMPNKVCIKCLSDLKSFTDFRRRSLKVEAKLRQIVVKRQRIAEVQVLYGPDFFDLNTSSEYPSEITLGSLYHGRNDQEGPDPCMSSVHTTADEVEDLLEIRNVKLPEIGEIEPAFNEGTNIDFQESCSDMDVVLNDGNDIDEVSLDKGTIELGVTFKSHCINSNNLVEGKSKAPNVTHSLSSNEIHVTIQSSEFDSSGAEEVVVADVKGDSPSFQNWTESSITENTNVDPKIHVLEDVSYDSSLSIPQDCLVVAQSNCNEPSKKQEPNCRRIPRMIPQVFVDDENSEERVSFSCEICKEIFYSDIEFRKHLPTHMKKKGGVCKFCEKWFPSRNALFRHERIHSGVKPFHCLLCDRSFSQKEILQRHILTHIDTKPFKCKDCDKSYTQKEGLNNHIKNHHRAPWEITQYPCNLCDKAFCHSSGLSRHMMIHTGKKVICEFCNREFHDVSSLRRHTRNKHPDQTIER